MWHRILVISICSAGLGLTVGCAPAVSAPGTGPADAGDVTPETTVVLPYGDTAKVDAPPTEAQATAPSPIGTPTDEPAATTTPDLPIVLGGASAATDLSADPSCSPGGTAQVMLRWKVAADPGVAQRVDVSSRQDGFEVGVFSSSDELAPEAAELRWEGGLEGGLIHVWRVLSRQSDHWAASEKGTFSGPICGRDPTTPVAP